MKKGFLLTTSMFAIFANVAVSANDLVDPQQQGDSRTGDLEEIVVTGTTQKKTRFDILQSTNVMSGKRLEEELAPTLGETLDHLPGISSSTFGPSISRPVVRGLSGDRVRILIGGIGSIDASGNSPDHAIAGDTLTATSIEVLRGPATLLYGNNAVGGVINMLDGRIPFELPEDKVTGAARAMFGTNAMEKSVAGSVSYMATDSLVVHADGSFLDTGNMHIPGYLESDAYRELHGEKVDGVLEPEGEKEGYKEAENTQSQAKNVSFGTSKFFDGGFIGASISYMGNEYGIPESHEQYAAEHGGEEAAHGEEVGVRIDLHQTRADLMGETAIDSALINKVKFRFGWADYKHTEHEGEEDAGHEGVVGEDGTTFLNKGWESRMELIQNDLGNFSGSFGFQARKRNFEAIGVEAFVPHNVTNNYGVFGMESWTDGAMTVEGGLRLENTSIKAPDLSVSRDFTGFSFSGGASFKINDNSLIGMTGHHTSRAPSAEELFSDGPHLASQIYEYGDVNLGKETAKGGELTYRYKGDQYSTSFSVYYNRFDNFIYERFTGEEQNGLPVVVFSHTDARFWGMEGEGLVEVYRDDDVIVSLDGVFDFVKAKDVTNDVFLPRIPPLSITVGGELDFGDINFRTEMEWASAQKDSAPNELPTESYTKLDMSVSYRPYGEESNWLIILQARNLMDSEIRQHVSFMKDKMPSAGRDIRLSVKYSF